MESNPNDGKTIWTVVYSFTEMDSPMDDEIRTRVFDREDFAIAWIGKDYENTLSECQDEEAAHDVLDHGNNETNAEILVGDKDNEEVAYIHKWTLHRNILNYEV